MKFSDEIVVDVTKLPFQCEVIRVEHEEENDRYYRNPDETGLALVSDDDNYRGDKSDTPSLA